MVVIAMQRFQTRQRTWTQTCQQDVERVEQRQRSIHASTIQYGFDDMVKHTQFAHGHVQLVICFERQEAVLPQPNRPASQPLSDSMTVEPKVFEDEQIPL